MRAQTILIACFILLTAIATFGDGVDREEVRAEIRRGVQAMIEAQDDQGEWNLVPAQHQLLEEQGVILLDDGAIIRGGQVFFDRQRIPWQTSVDESGAWVNRGTPPAGPETVWTRSGDVINGTVLGMNAEGALRLAGETFAGEVTVRPDQVGRVLMRASLAESGRDELTLVNGDRLSGRLVALTRESVTLDTGAAGTLTFPRKVVDALGLGRGEDVLLASRFDQGRLEPWQSVETPAPQISDRRLRLNADGQAKTRTVFAELPQDGPVTMTVTLSANPSGPFECRLGLLAEEVEGITPRHAVLATVTQGKWFLGGVLSSMGEYPAQGDVGPWSASGVRVLRLAYDPRSKTACLWRDGQLLSRAKVEDAPASGRFVTFQSDYACDVTSIRVLRGIVTPAETQRPPGEEKRDVVALANGDRVSAKDVTLAGGQCVVETEFGKLAPTRDTLKWIVLQSDGRARPSPAEREKHVFVDGGRLSLRIDEMTPEHLRGRSCLFGEVTVRRDALREVRRTDFPVEDETPPFTPQPILRPMRRLEILSD